VPKNNAPAPKPAYRQKPPRVPAAQPGGPGVPASRSQSKFPGHPLPASSFTLKEDGTVEILNPESGRQKPAEEADSKLSAQNSTPPGLLFSHENPFLRLYHGNCLELLDAMAAKYPAGRFDAIFADPPYFLSNGGITCHAGRMVKVDKGDWDKSRGPELNHEFNLEWLRRCRRVLKPNGTIWVSGTHHVIFSIGYALQQLGYKILNDIAWEKPNPPPNLSCRYFTHSTETILWAARDEKSKHVFNYQEMRKVTGKQMKTVWRGLPTGTPGHRDAESEEGHSLSQRERAGVRENSPDEISAPHHGEDRVNNEADKLCVPVPLWQSNVWTLGAPTTDEKQFGKHPTQKPIALIERCLLASTNPGDLVLDPFMGGGTTAIAALRLNRGCVGIEWDESHARLALRRADAEIVSIWLRHFRVRVEFVVVSALCADSGRAALTVDKFRGAHASGVSSFGVSPNELSADASGEGKRPKNSRYPARVAALPCRPEISAGQMMVVRKDQKDLDLFSDSINGSGVDDKPQVPTERIFHECKFVFLSCAEVERGAVVHTTVDVSLQEAWAKTPHGKKRETTHVVRCETEIFRVDARTKV
jgi:site-specific DNA-methyltransferase (adenine-specific)